MNFPKLSTLSKLLACYVKREINFAVNFMTSPTRGYTLFPVLSVGCIFLSNTEWMFYFYFKFIFLFLIAVLRLPH